MPPKAKKLLERMKNSSANWKARDVHRLFRGFGFVVEHGKKHDLVWHPDYPSLRYTIPRHNEVLSVYVRGAVRIIDSLQEMQDTGDEVKGTNL